MTTYRIGAATIHHGGGQTVTMLSDGSEVRADWRIQPGQEQTAAQYGIPVEDMNRHHDLAHAILAHVLDLPQSPTLAGVASGEYWPEWAKEERAVLSLCSYAAAAGVDLEQVAARFSKGGDDAAHYP